jgi:hypothetical protein
MNLLIATLLSTFDAQAGSGPWSLSPGDHSLYLGVEAQRFDSLALSSGSGADDVVQVSDGMQTFGAKAIASLGLLPRLEGELLLPWQTVRNNRPSDYPCDALGMNACQATAGVGIIRARLKGQWLDQLVGAPLSAAVGAELRLGQLTASTRQRLTNRGEGTMDIGGFASIGRTGGLGKGYWSAYLEGGGRHRSRNRSFDAVEAPGAEFWAETELFLAPSRALAIGPTASWISRPEGVDIEEMLADTSIVLDRDRLSALSFMSAQAGAKALIRTGNTVTTSFGVSRTFYAVNNPTDVWSVDLGLSARGFLNPRTPKS